MNADEIRYALAKQVPDMRYRVSLHTNYGELQLHGRDAERVAHLVQIILKAKLRRLERAEQRQRKQP